MYKTITREKKMDSELTKQDILELFAESDARFEKRLERSDAHFEKRSEEFENRLKELDKRLGELTGTWGKFVEELVAPNSIELFRERGIDVTTSFQRIREKRNGKDYYQIDLMLGNDNHVVIVEVKSILKVIDVNEHLERL